MDKHITEATLCRVSAAYEDNRHLWVGTTNLDYEQTWVWNLTLIAKKGKLDLYKKVLRASASPPVAFPPVEIEGHLFADGGVRQNMVVVGLTGQKRPPPPRHGPGSVYVIQNGKESNPPAAVRNDLLGIAGSSLDVMLTNSMESLLVRAYIAARAHDYRFRTAAIPHRTSTSDTTPWRSIPGRCAPHSTRAWHRGENRTLGLRHHRSSRTFLPGRWIWCVPRAERDRSAPPGNLP